MTKAAPASLLQQVEQEIGKVEDDLVRQIEDAIAEAEELHLAVARLLHHEEQMNRLARELEEFEKQRAETETEIEEITSNFGSEDSFADLERLKELKLHLESVDKAIPLLQRKLDPAQPSGLTDQLAGSREAVQREFARALHPIQAGLQERIHANAVMLKGLFDVLSKAVVRARAGQTRIPANLFNLSPSDRTLEINLDGNRIRSIQNIW